MKRILHLGSQQGFSLLETMVGLGIFLTLVMASGFKMKSIKNRLDNVNYSQTADMLESRISDYATMYSTIEESINRIRHHSTKAMALRCFQERGCENGFKLELPLYLASQSNAVTGPWSEYSKEGRLCKLNEKSCGTFRVSTTLKFFCSEGERCEQASGATVRIKITSIPKSAKSKVYTYRDTVVEVDMPKIEEDRKIMLTRLECPAGNIMVGVGVNGKAICEDVVNIRAASAEVTIKYKECEVGEYVESINQRGVITCQALDL